MPLQNTAMFRRALAKELRAAARRMPVVTVTGPRQSGKTTLVRHTFPRHAYVSLERPDETSRAREDPLGFLAGFRGGVILGEVQRAPELMSYVQNAVDEDRQPGRFILTGSQNLLLMEGISQTLAGRTAALRLLPLTLADYFRTYVERDLRDVLRVLDVERAYRSHEVEFPEVTEVPWTVTVLDSVLREWERVHHTVRPHQSPGYRTLLRSSTTGAKPMDGGMRHGGTEPGHDLDNGRKVLVDYAEMPDPTDDDDLKLAHLYPSADR